MNPQKKKKLKDFSMKMREVQIFDFNIITSLQKNIKYQISNFELFFFRSIEKYFFLFLSFARLGINLNDQLSIK